MARGLSQAIARRMSASDNAGSSALSMRRRAAPLRGVRLVASDGSASLISCAREGGLDDLLLRQLAAAEIGDDAAVAEDVDVIAVIELLRFGGVPQERPAGASLGADEVVDLELGREIDAAHGIV